MFSAVACTCVVALSLAPARPAEAPKEAGPEDLQGAWRLESLGAGGMEPATPLFAARWVVKGTKILCAGQEAAALTADANATPKSLDLSPADSKKTYEGIYSVEGDKLTICLNARGEGVKERPTEFATKDKPGLRLLVLRRDKAEAGDSAAGNSGFVGLQLRLDKDSQEVVVSDAFEKAPAAKAGLRKDDVILKVGGVDATDLATAVGAVRRQAPGAELAFHIRRDGKEQDLTVKVGTVPLNFVLDLE